MDESQINTNENIENPLEEVKVLKKRSNLKIILIVTAAFVVLGGAAYLTGQLMNGSGVRSQNGPMIFNNSEDGGKSMAVVVKFDDEWPEVIPAVKADVGGVFVRRQDNLLTLGTGNVTTTDMGEEVGRVPKGLDYDGPEKDVLITPQTQIYRNATFDDLENGFTENNETIKHKVEDGSIDEITENSSVMVWGRKSGDRYVADVILYTVMGMIAVEVK